MSRRHSTPHPTAPPPLREEQSAVQRIVATVGLGQALIGIAIALIAAGGTAYAWQLGKADVVELHQVRDGAAAALGAAQASTGASLGSLQASVQDMRVRQATADAKANQLAADVSRLQATTDVIYLQLVELARTTGARQVRMPDPETVTRPP
jgi:hypothetical protein